MLRIVVLTHPAFTHPCFEAFAAKLAEHYPARLIYLVPGPDIPSIQAALREERADLLLMGFTPLPGATDEVRTAHIQSLFWNCPCPLLLVPNVSSLAFAPPRAIVLLADGQQIAPTWNVTLTNNLLQRWQPATTVLHRTLPPARAWALGALMDHLQAPKGLLANIAEVDCHPFADHALLSELTAAVEERQAGLLVLLPRLKQAVAPINRYQKLAVLLHCPVPVLVVSNV